MHYLELALQQMGESFAVKQDISPLLLGFHLLFAAVLAWFIRFLYRRCSASPSDTDSISRVFPLLALVITAVIAVVKSSLFLSLGLVGALSIVRFRAAIKDPEELVYLFLCTAIGLALGAEALWVALVLTGCASFIIVGMHLFGLERRRERLLLTITGDAQQYFSDNETGVMAILESVAGKYVLQRFDVEQGQGQMRVILNESSSKKTIEIITKLRQSLPDCELSYVNLNSNL